MSQEKTICPICSYGEAEIMPYSNPLFRQIGCPICGVFIIEPNFNINRFNDLRNDNDVFVRSIRTFRI